MPNTNPVAALSPRVKASGPKLTTAQRAKVREIMEDEGESRASAVAWVLAFEVGK
jgi:hypothetical protein